MTLQEWQSVRRGDILVSEYNGLSFVVTCVEYDNMGQPEGFVIVRSCTVYNPAEWRLFREARI